MSKVLNAFIVLSVLLLSGCSVIDNLMGANSLNKIVIESSGDSNNDTPFSVDFVFVNDPDITPLLMSLSGPEWFAQKRHFLSRYQQALSLSSLDVVPLSFIHKVEFPHNHKRAANILMFANYQMPQGQAVSELTGYHRLKIRFERNAYRLLEDKK